MQSFNYHRQLKPKTLSSRKWYTCICAITHTRSPRWPSCASTLCAETGNLPLHRNLSIVVVLPSDLCCSDNENPLIRGLALRSLCNLRLESILEYVQQPLQKSLNDISAYVRKTAVIGILKVRKSPTCIPTYTSIDHFFNVRLFHIHIHT